ncbi:recombinase family protein [Nocardioides ganghwensis]|uniref:Recombinase family protein n=1 Tax=Nocardioides ganghwensis TaxID=252230 RepID=A0A4Q2S8X0_9ACTN|nr:recombinase family protein [Nocardioides ganghwensis]MBD3948155.1 recombinase family protein [Nocardioides ganghwensis]RYB96908.1 recombinase family protein [Nocardioides ganghwensis]
MSRRKKQPGNPGVVVAYLRVSTDEQAASGAGIEAQRAAIEAEVARRGWVLHGTFTDAGMSGKSITGRPALAEALGTVESGEAGTLIVAKLDRLSRSLLDFAALMKRAQDGEWNLVALDLGIDLSTPAGEFLASVMASAAQWERRIISQRTKDALAAKRAAGVRLGRPSSLPSATRDRIVARRADGQTLRQIASDLNADGVDTSQGGRAWHASTVRAVLLIEDPSRQVRSNA